MIEKNKIFSGIYSIDYNFVDFPNKYALSLFLNGCNLSCWYCYNKEVCENNVDLIPLNYLSNELERSDKLFGEKTAIVFSGGEPTVNEDFCILYHAFEDRPKSIHTNGLIFDTTKKFDSVILSLKTKAIVSDLFSDYNDYIDTLINAIECYSNSSYKELRMVDTLKYREEYINTIDLISNKINLNGWKIKFQKMIKV